MTTDMTTRRIVHCDVFAARIGSGNPLAVILDSQNLTTAQMQAIAHWTNLAETTFILPPTMPEADYRVRIFTTQKEIAFAGHPSIGSAHALVDAGLQPRQAGLIMQECQAGLLPIRYRPELPDNAYSVRVPSSKWLRYADESDAVFREALPPHYWTSLKPALVEGGRRWWLAQLRDERSVREFQPDRYAIETLAKATGSLGLCIFAAGAHSETDLVVRAFPLGVGIDEDPASGAANAAIAAFLHETGQLADIGYSYRVSQGREIGRDAILTLEVDDENQVWVGGDCKTVIRGRLQW